MEEEKKSDIIDIKGILKEYTAKWYWFALSVVACCILGFLYSKTIKPEYEVKANIMLTEGSPMSGLMASGGLSGMASLFGGNASAEDEVEIVTSHSVLRDVARQLGLNITHFDRPAPLVALLQINEYPIEVVPAINPDTLRTPLAFTIKVKGNGEASIKVKAKDDIIFEKSDITLPYVVNIPYGDFTIQPTKDFPTGKAFKTLVNVTNYDVAAENLRKQINVGLVNKHSQIISMQMITDNVDYACQVLNTLIEKYNARGLEDHFAQTSSTVNFLGDRLVSIRAELDSTEVALAQYKHAQGITELEKDGQVIYERMAQAEAQLTEQEVLTQMNRITLQMVEQSAKDNSLIPQQDGDKTIAPMIDAYNNAVMNRMRIEQSAKADNPSLQRLDEQISSLRANLISTLQTSVARSEKLASEYRRVYQQAASQVSSLPSQELSYRARVRQQTIQEQIYLFLLQKQEESSMLMKNTLPKGAIVDEAYSLNEDKSTSLKVILLMCIVLGLCIPPATIYIRKQFGHKK